MLIVVVYLYSENTSLRRDIDGIQRQLANLELKRLAPSLEDPSAPGTMYVDTPTATYYVPNDSPNFVNTKPIGPNDPNQDPSYLQNYSARDVPQTPIDKKPATTIENSVETGLIYFSDKWMKLRKNMSRSKVKDLIGMPSQVVSFIDSSTYIYNYSSGEGKVTFNRFNKVIGWKKPY